MDPRDLTAVLIIGALAGLTLFAASYASMVWLARRRRVHALEAAEARPSPVLTALLWTCVTVAVACLARAVPAQLLLEREGLLSGEDLFAIKPRAGLVATYVASGPVVRAGEGLLRFRGHDGGDAVLAVRARRQLLEKELDLEESRPLESDPAVVRRADQAELLVRTGEQEEKLLASERDLILREAAERELEMKARRYRLEADAQDAEREVALGQASLRTARDGLAAAEALLARGLVSKLEVDRERESVLVLEGRLAHAEGRRASIALEEREVIRLGEEARSTVEGQLAARRGALEAAARDVASARQALERARAAVAEDRDRALAGREKRMRQIEAQIDECDGFLGGGQTVAAPFDGRIGFREPSPSSPPSDGGPLLVLYRPGRVRVKVRVPDQESFRADDLELELTALSTQTLKSPFTGEVIRRSPIAGGSLELEIACDPPDRVFRELAQGGTVPVRVAVRRPLAATPTFRVGAGFAAAAVLLGAARAVKRRRAQGALAGEAPAAPEPAVPQRLAFVEAERRAPALLGFVDLVEEPLLLALPAAGASGAGEAPSLPAPSEESFAGAPLPAQLYRLGAQLRQGVEATDVAPAVLERLDAALDEGGLQATGLVILGFGDRLRERPVAEAAMALLARGAEPPPRGRGLRPAVEDCARFLWILRTIGSARLNGALDRLERRLAAETRAAAARDGWSGPAIDALAARLGG